MPPFRRAAPMRLVLFALLAAGCSARAAEGYAKSDALRLEEVVRGLDSPVYAISPPGDPRIFVVEQKGRIRIVRDGRILDTPFLDIVARVSSGGERGLLSCAFDPAYAANGFVYVNYTDKGGDTEVVRFRVRGDAPDRLDPGSATSILHVAQPYPNHNGGHVLFGPDSALYVGMGDGGSGGDPHDNGQNPRSLLGKLLRIDVRGGRVAPPEIWASGLRNPWRFAFDPPAGLLYIADVGQDKWEEVNVAPLSSRGLNYGWNLREGAHDYDVRGRSTRGLTEPVLEYGHGDGCSITGGFVYRGRDLPDVQGTYFFADYCGGWVRSFRYVNGRATAQTAWGKLAAGSITSFGVDGRGELLVMNKDGRLYRIVRAGAGG